MRQTTEMSLRTKNRSAAQVARHLRALISLTFIFTLNRAHVGQRCRANAVEEPLYVCIDRGRKAFRMGGIGSDRRGAGDPTVGGGGGNRPLLVATGRSMLLAEATRQQLSRHLFCVGCARSENHSCGFRYKINAFQFFWILENRRNNHGRRNGGACPPGFWNLTFFHLIFRKKGCFLTSSGKKLNFTTFGPLLKKCFWLVWKIPLFAPPGKNPSDAHGNKRCKLAVHEKTRAAKKVFTAG